MMNAITTYTASEAREKLYSLLRAVSKGLRTYEITLRGNHDSVVLINKTELESWQETLDILTSKEELSAVRKGKSQKKTISHKQFLAAIGIDK